MSTEQREPVDYLRAGVGCVGAGLYTVWLALRELVSRWRYPR